MKTINKFFWVLAIAAIALAGCSKDDDPASASFESFTFTGIVGEAVIDKEAKTVTAEAGITVDITKIAAVFTLSGNATATVSSVPQVSGTTKNNFTIPVVYRITASDGTTADWTVSITRTGGTGGAESYGVKAATITYQITYVAPQSGDVTGMRFVFDDYGKRFRIEAWGSDGGAITLVDETAQTCYVLDPSAMTYMVIPYSVAIPAMKLAYTYLYDDAHMTNIPGITRLANRSYFGKSCTAVSLPGGMTFSGWKRILFFQQSPESKMEATNFSETIPANSFTVPSDYTQE